MKVLILGGGGREHALAWRLAKSPSIKEIIACPGNPGIAQVATCIPSPHEVSAYPDIAEGHDVDLTIVGPEGPLVVGVADQFHARRLRIIGPTRAAARLEGSKIFAKRLCAAAGIPTARSVQATSYDEAREALKKFGLPVVIKADGLAAGKGVVIAQSEGEAL
ncbi:MAG: phosphoribosylamine--glycine ligase, partial [Bryobacteraceae bacterium]